MLCGLKYSINKNFQVSVSVFGIEKEYTIYVRDWTPNGSIMKR